MIRIAVLAVLGALLVVAALVAILVGPWWWLLSVPVTVALGVAIWDSVQRRLSVLRNYPLIGHMRYLLETIRPELQQYFIERNFDGRPFNRDKRSIIYERAKGIHGEKAYGTELDVNAVGYEYLVHSAVPVDPPPERSEERRVGTGGGDRWARQ